jgi:hypothetical protein
MTRALKLKLGNLFKLHSWSHITSVTIMPVAVAYNDAIHFFNMVGVLQLHTIDRQWKFLSVVSFTFDFPHLFKIKNYMHFLLTGSGGNNHGVPGGNNKQMAETVTEELDHSEK